jgi:nucleotide-binding universal stress UspA family protein
MYRRILIVVSDHPSSKVAAAHGLCLGKALSARLLYVHVLPQLPVAVADMPPVVTVAPDEFTQQAARTATRLLAERAAQATAAGVSADTRMLAAPDGVGAMASLALDEGCDLIVIGTEGGNALVRLLTGSAVSGLITRAAVPVMVCHAHDVAPATS